MLTKEEALQFIIIQINCLKTRFTINYKAVYDIMNEITKLDSFDVLLFNPADYIIPDENTPYEITFHGSDGSKHKQSINGNASVHHVVQYYLNCIEMAKSSSLPFGLIDCTYKMII